MAQVEKLVVELDANIKKYLKKMKEAEKQNTKTGKTMAKLAAAAATVGTAALGAGIAIGALGAALAVLIEKAATSNKETELLAKQAGLATKEFEAFAFAMGKFGLTAEQTADISKDLKDKLGEFATVGTGAFQDFVDVIGITKTEGEALARSFEGLSSDQVIGRVVSMMEKTNATANQMTFVLESLGSDLSLATDLFRNNGEELSKLTGIYEKATAQLKLTAQEAENLRESAAAFKLLEETMDSAGDKLLAQIAPAFTDFISSIVEEVPAAVQAIESLLGAIGVIDVPDLEGEPLEITLTKGMDNNEERLALEAEFLERLNELRFTGQETQGELLEKELEILQAQNDAKLINETDFQKNRLKIIANAGKRAKTLNDLEIANANKKFTQEQKLINAGKVLNQAFFEDNKAIKAGLIVADTASAIMKSLSINPYDYVNVAILAATGAAQLANALSASSGGGSVGGGGGGGGVNIQNPPLEEFQEDTSILDLTEATAAGSQVLRVEFVNNTGDDIIGSLAEGLNRAQREGRS